MDPFDLTGPLPEGTTVLEASAGTGKTFAVGALVTRYIAEDVATLDEMLVITFGRAASQELRERVRKQLRDAERALADPERARVAGGLIGLLAEVDDDELERRRERLRDALRSYDAATIATTHQFCQLVLRSLGVAGDTDASAQLVDDLDDLVVEVVEDLYLARFGGSEKPPFKWDVALALARDVIADPQAALAPATAEAGTVLAARLAFAAGVRAEVERRKQRLGLLSYDDLLSRLATALEDEDSPARERMRRRWKIVLVDEFQDTDPVQWQVLERAFDGHRTMVLIGDPKQAIYAFRGGDIVTYLAASKKVTRRTLDTNWRSDAPLVGALQQLLAGTALGDPEIVVHPIKAAHEGSRLSGAPVGDPVRVRLLTGADHGAGSDGCLPIAVARGLIAEDLADDIARLLDARATYRNPATGQDEVVGAGHLGVLMQSLSTVDLFRDALARRGIASVVGGGDSVLTSAAAEDWLTLLEALEQPHRSARVRALALTPFIGRTAAQLDDGGDAVTDEVADEVRGWLDLMRRGGVAAIHDALTAGGLAGRVLSVRDGERRLTDLNHLAQLLHEVARRDRLGLPALLDWLRTERRSKARVDSRTRRLDTDADAVQFTTIHTSKGLQYPVVYLPLAFNRWIPDSETHLFHDGSRRLLDVTGSATKESRAESAGEELRLAYVALTRAECQVVAWVAPVAGATGAGLSRLLLGRAPGDVAVPDTISKGGPDSRYQQALEAWAAHGAFVLEPAVSRPAALTDRSRAAQPLEVREFARILDENWRRTSYSGLIRAEDQPGALLAPEPEVEGTVDEVDLPDARLSDVEASGPDLESPMAGLPAGASFGSLVHAVLEHADPDAPDLHAELLGHVAEHREQWSIGTPAEDLAAALVPLHHTSLGPLADRLTLAQLPLRDRLRELDFEFPLAGGDRPVEAEVRLSRVADLIRAHLDATDPMRAYADRLESPLLGDQVLRGYLSGSIDVVLRVPDGDGHRYVVVDYKTNRLGEPDRPLSALDYRPTALTAAMLHSHYPLQALLYSVVVHRYLRWRQPGYDPELHLGGILYLYVRGMCGPETPEVDGAPCGVFAWHPPAALVIALSELLDGAEVT